MDPAATQESDAQGTAAPPTEAYRRREAASASGERDRARRSRAFSWARLAVFLALVGSLLLSLWNAGARPLPWLGAAAALGLAFAALALAHDRVIRQQARFSALRRENREGLARLERRWRDLPLPSLPSDLPQPAFARDLDLLGRASLLHLLGTVHSPPGKTTLARWLLAPALPATVRERQEAVEELAGELDLRQELALATRPMERADPDVERFLAWCEGEPWLLARPLLLAASRLLPLVGILALAAWLAGLWPFFPAGLAWLASFTLAHLCHGRIDAVLDRVGSGEDEFASYGTAFALLAGRDFGSPLLRRLAGELHEEGEPASRLMERLHRRTVLADARHSASLRFFLDTLLLWDFHTLYLVERWQVVAGRSARRWLTALGELEALAALAGLRFDHPAWSFPAIEPEGSPALVARALAHPLLPPATAVGNDVTVGPPGSFLLVSGSNMSGKSTLLRALGVNVVLAQAGGPVAAASLRLPPLVLGTSVLIEDSLESGVSFFMAELLRIKEVVDLADRAGREGDRRLLFLLDEVLRGTNAAERRIAVQHILRHLLASGSIGAVATHDLALAEVPELVGAAVPVHFRETLRPAGGEGPAMTFDYRLRPGIATTTNALALLEIVGLTDGARKEVG